MEQVNFLICASMNYNNDNLTLTWLFLSSLLWNHSMKLQSVDAWVNIFAIIIIIIIITQLCLILKIEHKFKSSESEIMQHTGLNVLLKVSEFLYGVTHSKSKISCLANKWTFWAKTKVWCVLKWTFYVRNF